MKHALKVRCPSHGERPGYVICRCILEGCDVREVIPCRQPFEGPRDLGQILCGNPEHGIREYRLICDECAVEKGFVKAP